MIGQGNLCCVSKQMIGQGNLLSDLSDYFFAGMMRDKLSHLLDLNETSVGLETALTNSMLIHKHFY